MCSKCVPNVFQCVPNVFQVCSKCVPNVFQMYSKCVPNVSQMYSKCVPNVFHTMVRGPWSMDHGPWTMVRGPRSVDHGPWIKVRGPWSMDHGALGELWASCTRKSQETVYVCWLTLFSPLDLRTEISARYFLEIARNCVPHLFCFLKNHEFRPGPGPAQRFGVVDLSGFKTSVLEL